MYLFILNCILSILQRDILGHVCLTNLYRNFSSLEVLELKNKINSGTLNYIICARTWSKKEIWVGKAFGFVILQKKCLCEEDKTCQPPEKYKMRCK